MERGYAIKTNPNGGTTYYNPPTPPKK